MDSSSYSSMGLAGGLGDLSLLMDSNIRHFQFSVLSSSGGDALPASSPLAAEEEECEVQVEEVMAAAPCSPAAPVFPFAGTASLSFALSSAVAANPLLSNPMLAFGKSKGFSGSQAATQTTAAVKTAKKSSGFSQVQCNAPIPVMAASKVVEQQQDVATVDKFKKAFKSTSDIAAFPDLSRLPGSNGGFSPSNFASGMKKAVIMWFRNDLRVHDQEALAFANNSALSVLPVYCFDPRDYGKSSSGFDKTGPYRAKFLLECVSDLRDSLRARGSDLVIRIGRPEEVLVQLAKSVGAEALYAHQEVTYEEVQAENKVLAAFKKEGIETKVFWGSTLYHIDDLPFKSLEEMPSNYGGFKEMTKGVKVRSTAEVSEKLKSLPTQGGVKAGNLPSLLDLGISQSANTNLGKAIGGAALVGGESEALKRLKRFVAEAAAQSQRETGKKEDGLMGASFSCKISPWLASGCLSPRRMFQDLQSSSRGPSASVDGALDEKSGINWLVFELVWRDFFRFITKRYGSSTRKGGAPAPAVAGAAV